MKKIAKVAKRLGVSEWKIKEVLDLPLVDYPINDLSKAGHAWYQAPKGSEQERVIFLNWDRLAYELIERATSKEEVREWLSMSPENGDAKISGMIRLIDFCSTEHEVYDILISGRGNPKVEKAAIMKIYDLTPEENAY